MLFNSFIFWILFPLAFLIYWGAGHLLGRNRRKFQNIFLIISSYFLYMNWKPVFALFLLGITLVTFFGALLIEKSAAFSPRAVEGAAQFGKGVSIGKHSASKRLTVSFLVVATLFPLLLFKYSDFLNSGIEALLNSVGLRVNLPGLNWAIPVGISFFTFQAVGYLWDVYYKRISAEHSFLDYVLFVCFFPQIVSGPISKAASLLPQLKRERTFDYRQGVDGLKWLVWGMFLKLFVADRIGLYVDTVFNGVSHFNGTTLLVSCFLYAFQIYGDFAGYSFMALGIAKTMGIDLINNFNRPYFSISVTDFWHRWHISLSQWLRDYIYIPLGGNRCSTARNYWNIFVTFLVSGIWHGAGLTFIVWGCIHGIVQIIEKATGQAKLQSSGLSRYFRIFVTFVIVDFAWIFFRSPSLGVATEVIGTIATNFGRPDFSVMGMANISLIAIGLIMLAGHDIKDEFFERSSKLLDSKMFKWIFYVFVFCLTIAGGVLDSGQFIYANF